MITALGIIPLVVFIRTIQRVFSVNINDNNHHPIADWTTNILDITNEKAQYNLMMASADIIFNLLTSEVFKWSRKNIIPCCPNENNRNARVNSTYPITLAIHFWSTFSNHVVVTAAAMYTLDSFTWTNYALKLIDKFNILSTIARLYAMTSINDWFKWSLATINNELQLSNKVKFCSNIFNNISNSINESYYFIKFITAVFGFGVITFSSNALKNLASLIAENGFELGYSKFPNKFFTWGMLGTATAMSLTDGLNLMLNNYKKSIWKPFVDGTKWIWNKATLCCFMNNSEYTQFDDDLAENGGIINHDDGIKKEILAHFANIEGQNKDLDALINKFKLLNISKINATQPPEKLLSRKFTMNHGLK